MNEKFPEYKGLDLSEVNKEILNTGPSLQTHKCPSSVFSTQHKHAPTPQAILFSSETSHSIP